MDRRTHRRPRVDLAGFLLGLIEAMLWAAVAEA